jgi:hypothetical protein
MVAIAFRVFSANELPASFIGACLGAIISAIITQTLLSAQTQSEEVKERNVKIWETKSAIFLEYIGELREIWEEQRIKPQKFKQICDDFRIRLTVYLNNEAVNKIAGHLDKLGDCSIKKEPDFDMLNANIYGIINILSNDLGFNGKINPEIDKRLDEKINKFPRDFRDTILKELNNALLNMPQKVLAEGKYERLEDGGEYACFYFLEPKYRGCKLIIGSISQYCAHGGIYLGLYFEKSIHEVDEFRWDDDEESNYPEFSKYWVGVFDTQGRVDWVKLTTDLPDPKKNEKTGGTITEKDKDWWLFIDKPDTIEEFRDNYRKVARILGKRAAWWFEHGEIWEGEQTLSITNFLKKYLGNK